MVSTYAKLVLAAVAVAGMLTAPGGAGLSEAAADFSFPNFTSGTGLNLVGAAATTGGRLRLTPAESEVSGAGWAVAKQSVSHGFQTSFQFELQAGNHSDGFAFVIQNSAADALFGPGARLGYGGFGDETGGISNSLAIEFDTFQNSENSDPSNNHISVQSRGTLPNSSNHLYSLGQVTPGTTLAASGVHEVSVNYVPGTLSLYLDGSTLPLLTVAVDLDSLLSLDDGQAWVGFTAGTGADLQIHDIVSWQFASVPEPTSLSLLGCATCVALAGLARRRFASWRCE